MPRIDYIQCIIYVKKQTPKCFRGLFMWYLQESNQGHMDFQSIALPTELRHRLLSQIINLAAANIMVFLLQQNNFLKNIFI